MFDTKRFFGDLGRETSRAIVTVKTNSGTLTIASVMEDGSEITIEGGVISEDSAFELTLGNGLFSFTPSGGCQYQVALG